MLLLQGRSFGGGIGKATSTLLLFGGKGLTIKEITGSNLQHPVFVGGAWPPHKNGKGPVLRSSNSVKMVNKMQNSVIFQNCIAIVRCFEVLGQSKLLLKPATQSLFNRKDSGPHATLSNLCILAYVAFAGAESLFQELHHWTT